MEHVFGVLGHIRRIAMPPGGMDGVTVDDPAVRQACLAIEPGLFPQLAPRGLQGRLLFSQAAGHRLPETRRFLAQQLQDLTIVGMHDDQNRLRAFKCTHSYRLGCGPRMGRIFPTRGMEPGKTTFLPGELKSPRMDFSAYVKGVFVQGAFGSVTGSFTRMCSSMSCSSLAVPGASVSGSQAVWVLGKAMTSRMLGAPVMSITSRSMPKAMPPWGGQPDFKASSRKPNFCLASSSLMPSIRNTAACMSWSWIRMEPPPNSVPFSTMS